MPGVFFIVPAPAPCSRSIALVLFVVGPHRSMSVARRKLQSEALFQAGRSLWTNQFFSVQ